MYNHWELDMADSVVAIKKMNDDGYLGSLIKGKIHTVEHVKNDLLVLMDIKCGIDYIREDETGLQGIAARVQWRKKPYYTFTIREERYTGAKTEYEKRVEQIKNGYFHPRFTMQAYCDNRTDNNLLSAAMCKTVDLYEFVEKYPELIRSRMSDNLFMAIGWSDFEEKYELHKVFNRRH